MKILEWLCLLLVVMAGILPGTHAHAQGQRKAMKANTHSGPDPAMVRLVRGDTLFVQCDSAFVFNRDAELVRREQIRVDDSLIAQLQARVALSDSIRALKDSVVSLYGQMNAIQNQSYEALRARFFQADSLVKVSTANTDAALSYIKRIKLTGYLASGLAGGVVGGFGIKKSGQEGFNWWPGFVVGAATGVGIDWLLTEVF